MHVLKHHSDPGEELWLNEALATYVGFRVSKPFLSRSIGQSVADTFLESPNVGLTEWHSAEETRPKYGAGLLFIMHLTQRFGDEIVARLLAEPANGWLSVTKVAARIYGTDG